MKDTKDFQERYNRWKNGERYWDIRGVELPKYDTGKYVTVEKDDGSVYNVNPNVVDSKEITVTTPEVEVVAQKPQWMIDRDNKIGQIIPTQYTLREDNTLLSSQVDKFIDKYKYKTNNVILSGLANAADDWRRDKSPLRAAARYFGWWNPIASSTTAILDDKLNTQSNTPKLIIPELIMDYGNKYGSAIRGYNHLMSKDGLKKTIDYYNTLRNSNPITDSNYAGKFWNTVTSGIGDVLDLSFINRAINNALPRNIGRIPISDNFYYKSRDVATKLKQQIDQAKQAYRNYKDVKAGYGPYYEIPLDVKFPPSVEIPITKQLAGKRHQFDVPTYQIYTGPRHSISEIMDRQGNVKLRNLLKIQNEALEYIPGGTIARHILENKTWHPTDWNVFLHTRDAYKRALDNNYPQEALFPTLMHDFGKMWSDDGHGPYGASIIRQIFPEASNEQIQAIYEHTGSNPQNYISKLVKGADIKEPNQFRTDGLYEYLLNYDKSKLQSFVQNYFKQKAQHGVLNVYHSTDHEPFTTFKPTKGHMGGLIEPFFHFGDINTKKFFEKFPEYTTKQFNIKGSNFLDVDDFTHSTPSGLIAELYRRGYITKDKLSLLREKMYDKRYFDRPDLFAQDVLTELNSDGIHYINKVEGIGSNAYGVTNPNYIKLSDPIVYDDFGKIIPLSQRFDFTKSDFRYNNGKEGYPVKINLPKYGGGKIGGFVHRMGPLIYQGLVSRGVKNINAAYANLTAAQYLGKLNTLKSLDRAVAQDLANRRDFYNQTTGIQQNPETNEPEFVQPVPKEQQSIEVPYLDPQKLGTLTFPVNQPIIDIRTILPKLKPMIYQYWKSDKSFYHGKSGIHINPANRGKFNATKKRTGKTTKELTHSKNPLTRKRAIFALNASKWNKK